jgi:outer membrane lipoprotein-sorting protein
MILNFKKYTLLFLFLASFLNFAKATPTANKSLQKVYEKLMKLKDYSAEVNIQSNIPLIKILPVKAKIYFKQPNQFKIMAKGIAILPKQGFSDLALILKDSNSYLAVLAGNETIDQTATQIIHLIPNNDTSDLIIAKFWVDVNVGLILKSQLTTKSNGNLQINYEYDPIGKPYGLPHHLVFTVDVKKFKIPKALAADVNKTQRSKMQSESKSKIGSIDIRLTNIQINKGIDDKIFKK